MKKHFDHWQGFIEALDVEKVWIRLKTVDSSRKTSIGDESVMECPISTLSHIDELCEGLCLDIYADKDDVVIKTIPKQLSPHKPIMTLEEWQSMFVD